MPKKLTELENLNRPINLTLLAKIVGMNKETLKYWIKGGLLKPAFIETGIKRNIKYFTLKDGLLLILLKHLVISLGSRINSMKTISFWLNQKSGLAQIDHYFLFLDKTKQIFIKKKEEQKDDLFKNAAKIVNFNGKNHCMLDEISKRIQVNHNEIDTLYVGILLPNENRLVSHPVKNHSSVKENSVIFYFSNDLSEIKMNLWQSYFPRNTNISLIVYLKPIVLFFNSQIKQFAQDIGKISEKITKTETIKRIIT